MLLSSRDDLWASFEEALAAGQPDPGAEISFYAHTFTQPGASLEVCFGTGSRLLGLLELGHDIQGVETSQSRVERLLGRAASRGLTPRLHLRTLHSLDLADRFHNVVLSRTALTQLFSAEEQLAALQSIHHHLVRNGQLLIDATPALSLAEAAQLGRRVRLRDDLIDPVQGVRSVWYVERELNPLQQVVRIVDIVERYSREGQLLETWRRSRRERLVMRFELEHVLARAGFHVTARYGDFHRSPPSRDSASLLWVARRVER